MMISTLASRDAGQGSSPMKKSGGGSNSRGGGGGDIHHSSQLGQRHLDGVDINNFDLHAGEVFHVS